MDTLRAAAEAERVAHEASDEHQTFRFRRKRIVALLHEILKMPASELTVGDILFVGEKPTPMSQWSTHEDTEFRFYTQERLDRLMRIRAGTLPYHPSDV